MKVFPKISSSEWRWAIGWSLTVVLLSCVPYLIAAMNTPENWSFTGILVNPLDAHSYLAKMRQGSQGNWMFHLTYTPQTHNGAYIFIFYLGLGHLSAFTGIPAILIFHMARLLAGFFLLITAFQFIARVTTRRAERRPAFIFVCTASGLGWLGIIFGLLPIDLWVPEAFVPYSLYTNPHFPLGIALMLVIFNVVLDAETGTATFSLSGTLIAGATGLLLATILPFALLTVWAVLAIFLVWRFFSVDRRIPWAQGWLAFSVVIFSAPVIFYQYQVSTTNPTLAGWSAQNITDAPKLIDFILGYGVVGFLSIPGGWFIIRKAKSASGKWLALLWAATTIILVYLPFFNLQRRLITGLHIPVCILAATGLSQWMGQSKLNSGAQRLLTTTIILVSALGTLFVWSIPLVGATQNPDISPTTALLFIRLNEQTAFDWLQANSKPDDVILASPRVGMFIPGQTGARTFYGHPFETSNAKTRQAQVEAFYHGKLNAAPSPVDFIFFGPAEQKMGHPAILNTLPVVFSAGEVNIYSVQR